MNAVFIGLFAGIVGYATPQPVSAADVVTYKETVLYSFCSQKNCKDGAYPEAAVVDVNGVLYGTTEGGGRGVACYTQGCGTVFSLDPNTGAETVLHSFCQELNCPDGAYPFESGLLNMKGSLYGTAFVGGGGTGCYGYGCGTVFSLDPGTGTMTVLHSFTDSKDGAAPQGGLIHVKRTIYGTTQGGGSSGMGTVFALDRKTDAETVLYSFCATGYPCTDGFNPIGLIDLNGTLYGTTLQGGSYKCDQGEDCGTAYSLDPDTGTHTVLHSFGNGTDGWYANGLITVNGILYGTTSGGGDSGKGTVFTLDPSTGAEAVLYSFTGGTDGAKPFGGLVAVNGILYGTTSGGGESGKGTVFTLDPSNGAETVLYSFSGSPSDGGGPNGVINVNGTLYGTTSGGGAYGYGTVFALTKTRQARARIVSH